jgi:hypothetical protein
MNIRKSFTLRWWQVGIFKLCLLSLGIIVGAYWSELFLSWVPLLSVVFVLSDVYLVPVWWRQ